MNKQTLTLFRSFVALAFSLGLLAGCSSSFVPDPIQTDKSPIGNIEGMLHGGQAPISGAAVYLYAAGTGGYGTGATSLLRAGGNTVADGNGNYYVTTDANGGFNISGDYTCTAGQQVYIIAVGGDAGSGPNSAIMQMAGLGTCPVGSDLAAQVPFVMINEVSTVVFAYAMGGFGSSAYNMSGASTTLAQTGMTNAMANVSNILSIGTGTAYTQAKGNANSTVPQKEIDTLANILANCVNSTGASSSQCKSLFKAAPDLSGNAATDEATAIFNIVHNPASTSANVTALYNLSATQPVFSPSLGAAPKDWTLPIVYTGLVNTPFNIAFDTNGNAWIGDKGLKSVIKVKPQGGASSFNKNQSNSNKAFGTMKGLAIAPDGNIWATDFDNNNIYIMNSSGVVTSTISGLNGPAAVAFGDDADGVSGSYVGYVANETGGSVAGYSLSGGAKGNGTVVTNINEPAWIGVDNNNQIWLPSTPTGGTDQYLGEVTVTETTTTSRRGVVTTTYTYTPNNYNTGVGSYAVALDSGGHLWMGDTSNPGTLYEEVPQYGRGKLTGVSATSSHGNGGLSTPYMAAVDGAGTVWISNDTGATVSGWNQTAGAAGKGAWLEESTATGLQTGGTGVCLAATPDPSGNLWTANSDGTVTELLGVASPTAAPLIPGNLGVEP